MILFGLLLTVLGLCGGLFFQQAQAARSLDEVTRNNLVTASIACLVVGIVIFVLGILLP
jgi:hypothetical protein